MMRELAGWGNTSAGQILAAEQAIRATVRRTNRLIAGTPLGVQIADPAIAEAVRRMLRDFGAQLGSTPELWVSDTRVTPSDAAAGDPTPEQRIAAAAALMPATRSLANQLRQAGVLAGVRVAVSLVLEPKTAVLALALQDAGAEVHIFGAVTETQPEVAAALRAAGVLVSAPTVAAETPASSAVDLEEHRDALDAKHAAAVLDWQPQLLIDDGAHLIRLAHRRNGGAALAQLLAASEETTSGVRPLRAMLAEGALRIPVVAANDARTKTDFDNRIGTGESCVCAIADALDPLRTGPTAEQHWVIVGYGPVGYGVARAARAFGASVSVIETDAVRALAARLDGYSVGDAPELIPDADVLVSATGIWHTITEPQLRLLRPGAAVAVAGGVDHEVALDDARRQGWRSVTVSEAPGVSRWFLPETAAQGEPSVGIWVLAGGGGVNYTIADGNPVEVMDLSFATQLAALEWLVRTRPEVGVHTLPTEVEQAVANAALNTHGIAGASNGVREQKPSEGTGAAPSWRAHRYLGKTE